MRAAEVLRARTPAARLAAVLKESMLERVVGRGEGGGEIEIDFNHLRAPVERLERLGWLGGKRG